MRDHTEDDKFVGFLCGCFLLFMAFVVIGLISTRIVGLQRAVCGSVDSSTVVVRDSWLVKDGPITCADVLRDSARE